MAHLPQLVLCMVILMGGVGNWTWGPVAPWALILLLPLPHLVVLSGRNLVGAGSFRMGALVGLAGRYSGVFAFALLVLCCGWVQWLRIAMDARLDLSGWPELALIAAVLPYLAFEALAIDAQSRAAWPPGAGRSKWRGFHLRMFLSALVPPGVYCGFAALVGSNRWLRVQVEQVELAGAFVFALLVLGLAAYLPMLLQVSWRTHELGPGPLRRRFESISKAAGFTARKVLIWETDQMMANAAIVGLLPSRRIVLLSDALIAQLDEDELSAVYAHEMGHAHHHHVPVFLAWAVGAFMMADLALRGVGPTSELGALWIALTFLGAWAIWFGWMSRRFELQADLFALRAVGSPEPLISALRKIEGSLGERASWRHFGGLRRARFLERAVADPGTVRAFEVFLKRLGTAGFVLCALGLLGETILMVGGLKEDRAWAALGLGQYRLAQKRVADIESPDPDLARLVARTREHGGGQGSREDSLRRAWSEWQGGDREAVSDWASLAFLQGGHEAEAIVEILESLRSDEAVTGEVPTGNLPEPWKNALTRALTGVRDHRP